MSKISKLKLELAKLLASFMEIKTDKAVLTYPSEEDLQVGFEVYVINEDGEYVTPEDGEYKTEDGKVITISNGKVESINEVEEEQPEAETEPEAEVEVAAEEPVEEVTEEPEEKDEPKEEDSIRKELDELYALVESLVKEVSTLKETVDAMGKMSAAMSAQEEIEKVNTVKDTGDSVLNKKLKNFIG
jgi:flagellar basal body rod protein FlgG